MRIALFTPFSPEIGGGSVQLRSHLEQLTDLEIDWYYLAKTTVPGSRKHWLGAPLTANEFLSDLSARTGFLPGSKAPVRSLVGCMEADLYWVVGHYEGISVAAELIDQKKKLHMTVHDDPFGTWKRSERYRMFRPLLQHTFPKVLRSAQSIDVTSWGMRNLYRQKYRVKCFSLYRHIAHLPSLFISPDQTRLTIGHIGTLYQSEPFRQFVSACKEIAGEQNRVLRIIRIGSSPEIDAIAAHDPEIFQAHGDLPEQDAIPLLASCDFLYAMYPAGSRYELFRRTSLPIKLSTYVQTLRPIFAHSPPDSTLACVVNKYQVGRTCESDRPSQTVAAEIRHLLGQTVPRENFERVKNELLEPWQLQKLAAALRGEDWERLPEFDCHT
jgi:hypothetical protein